MKGQSYLTTWSVALFSTFILCLVSAPANPSAKPAVTPDRATQRVLAEYGFSATIVRPWVLEVFPEPSRSHSTRAVDESGITIPQVTASTSGRPIAMATKVAAVPVSTTWAVPEPKTVPRMRQSSLILSLRPTVKSNRMSHGSTARATGFQTTTMTPQMVMS